MIRNERISTDSVILCSLNQLILKTFTVFLRAPRTRWQNTAGARDHDWYSMVFLFVLVPPLPIRVPAERTGRRGRNGVTYMGRVEQQQRESRSPDNPRGKSAHTMTPSGTHALAASPDQGDSCDCRPRIYTCVDRPINHSYRQTTPPTVPTQHSSSYEYPTQNVRQSECDFHFV